MVRLARNPLRASIGILCLLVCVNSSACLIGSTDDSTPADSKVDNSPMFNKLHRESAMGSLNAIRTGETSYMAMNGSYGTLSQLVQNRLLDDRFDGDKPVVLGYAFTISTSGSSYSVNADPKEGEGRHFYMNQDNIIRFNDKAPASSSDPIAANS